MDISQWLYPVSPSGLGTAALCGIIIGLERQLSGKAAGIRTSTLICMGAYFFTAISGILGEDAYSARVIGQIVTGIGFIGAGVIIGREGIVLGVTTAAVIWVLAAIGIMIGLDRCITAIILSVMTVVLLTGVTGLESICKSLQRGVHKRLKKR
ncbi:MAG: MgtC/SapB family protein [Phycisphaerae bacterium]|nr:MgtC/SapB family protein [Phycisphaerae bacterium]